MREDIHCDAQSQKQQQRHGHPLSRMSHSTWMKNSVHGHVFSARERWRHCCHVNNVVGVWFNTRSSEPRSNGLAVTLKGLSTGDGSQQQLLPIDWPSGCPEMQLTSKPFLGGGSREGAAQLQASSSNIDSPLGSQAYLSIELFRLAESQTDDSCVDTDIRVRAMLWRLRLERPLCSR